MYKGGIVPIANMFIGNYERDIITFNINSRFITEYEVKISRADFLNDSKKCIKRYDYVTNKDKVFSTKHEHLEKGHSVNRFYYITPKGLLKKEELPVFAGLYEYDEKDNTFNLVKMGKTLHRNKVDEKFLIQLIYKLDNRYYQIAKRYKMFRYSYDQYKKDRGFDW